MKVPTFLPPLVHGPLVVLVLAACARTDDVRTGDGRTYGVRTGSDVLSDWTADAPGHRLHIRPSSPAAEVGKTRRSRFRNGRCSRGRGCRCRTCRDGFACACSPPGFKLLRTLRRHPRDIFLSEAHRARAGVPRGRMRSGVAVVFANLDALTHRLLPSAIPLLYVAAANRWCLSLSQRRAKSAGPA